MTDKMNVDFGQFDRPIGCAVSPDESRLAVVRTIDAACDIHRIPTYTSLVIELAIANKDRDELRAQLARVLREIKAMDEARN